MIHGAHDGPIEGDRRQVVGDPCHLAYVVLGRRASLARFKVDGLHPAAVGGDVHRRPVQDQIKSFRTGAHGVVAGRVRHGLEHHVWGQLDDLRRRIDQPAVGSIDLPGPLRGYVNPDLVEKLQRGRFHVRQLLIAQDAQVVGRHNRLKLRCFTVHDFLLVSSRNSG